jgi:hypothetical protein
MTTREANERSPPMSACDGDAVLRTSTRGTVHMGQCDGLQRTSSHSDHPVTGPLSLVLTDACPPALLASQLAPSHWCGQMPAHTPCICSFHAGAGRCPPPRTPCICSSGAGDVRCPPPRTPCTRSSDSAGAGRCSPPRTPCIQACLHRWKWRPGAD